MNKHIYTRERPYTKVIYTQTHTHRGTHFQIKSHTHALGCSTCFKATSNTHTYICINKFPNNNKKGNTDRETTRSLIHPLLPSPTPTPYPPFPLTTLPYPSHSHKKGNSSTHSSVRRWFFTLQRSEQTIP